MRAISLGWGVQSWTLAAMAALGVLDADVAIHADTTWERSATYEFARQWKPWLESHGVRVETVVAETQVVENGMTNIPAYTKTDAGGQLRRQCTNKWKIQPIRRFLSSELQRLNLRKTPGVVELLLGISLDEWRRVKDSDVKWIVNSYPLIDMKMSRGDCVRWLTEHDLPIPPKSSCVFCPFQSINSWKELKRDGKDWEIAVIVDEEIRKVRPPYDLFVHPAMQPLADAVTIAEDFGMKQASMFDDGECDNGYCFA